MNIELPNDLRKYVLTRILKRIISLVLLLSVTGTVLYLWGGRIFNMDNPGLRTLCYIVTLMIPFFVSGVPLKLTDRSYCGKVERAEIKTTTDSSSSAKPTRETLYTKYTVYLSVTQPDGKTVRKKAYEGATDPQNFYKAGDTVFHLGGTNNVIVLPQASDDTVRCAVCGDTNSKISDACKSCGHTLIKKI